MKACCNLLSSESARRGKLIAPVDAGGMKSKYPSTPILVLCFTLSKQEVQASLCPQQRSDQLPTLMAMAALLMDL
jgi:hypothetical protein